MPIAKFSCFAFLWVVALWTASCAAPPVTDSPAQEGPQQVMIYSGRNENLIGPLVDRFAAETGIKAEVRYGDTAEMAATILEEGQNSPADVFFAQDAGALGALAAQGRLRALPNEIVDRVDPRLRSRDNQWVGVSGRARVVVYNTEELTEADLPDSLWGFIDPRWHGRIGWAPTNGSFQAMITAMRQVEGQDRAKEWLQGILANEPKVYPNNTSIVDAVGKGEIDVGFVNHYYLFRFLAEQGDSFPARNYHPRAGDVGAMINVAGVGIVDTASNAQAAERFLAYLLTPDAQRYFAQETSEYPLIQGVDIDPRLKPLDEIQTPSVDLSDLTDLQGTLELLQEVGAL